MLSSSSSSSWPSSLSASSAASVTSSDPASAVSAAAFLAKSAHGFHRFTGIKSRRRSYHGWIRNIIFNNIIRHWSFRFFDLICEDCGRRCFQSCMKLLILLSVPAATS